MRLSIGYYYSNPSPCYIVLFHSSRAAICHERYKELSVLIYSKFYYKIEIAFKLDSGDL